MTNYLITGAAGFIGSNLAEHLIEQGETVVGVDNFLTGKRENIASLRERMRFVEGDIRDASLMNELCEGVDYVLHHAAMASVPWSMKEPMLCHEHNATGTLNVLLAARDAGVKKVVMAVTSAAYGNTETLPAHEALPTMALSPYGATKLIGEIYLQLFSTAYALPTVGLRYFNVFGKRQDPQSAYAAAIPIFAKKLIEGKAPTIFGDGEQTRDFVYIKDVVQANLKACTAPPSADGQVFNIGTGTQITVTDLIRYMSDLLDIHIAPDHVPERAGDVKHSVADITKAEQHLGYTPDYTVYEGLKEAIEWYRKNL
ncbi:MAG: SDR family oxidoreductase [Deltaproteobacteria bacterium]|nr:SDR family oxidoreductase [Deltaproteobacteria bacterium]MBN2670843.1 SDR family oxidoreductase [Deltaproteobacteria bacterium]